MLDIMLLGIFLKDSPHNSQSIDLYLHPFTAPCLEQIAPCILKPPNHLKQIETIMSSQSSLNHVSVARVTP